MKNLMISLSSFLRAPLRALLILAFVILAIGQYTPAYASEGEATLNFGPAGGSTPFESIGYVCVLYNAANPSGLALASVTGDLDFDYPATVECIFGGTSGATYWLIYSYAFLFTQLPEDSLLTYNGVNWNSGSVPISGEVEPDLVGSFNVWSQVDNPQGVARTSSLTFTADIGGGFEHSLCSESFVIEEPIVIDNDIYPFVEFPQGPDPEPPNLPDEMIVELYPPLIEGQTYLYKLIIEGIWSDGTTPDMAEYEVSFDGENWIDPADLDIVCDDSTGIIFETGEELFYIRVADVAGQYLDNTPASPPYPVFSLYSVTQVAPVTCSDKYNYDVEADYVAAGIIYADDMFGTIPEAELIPGEWYMLETVDGPWTNDDPGEGLPAESYDIAVDLVDSNIVDEVEFSEWEYTDCWEFVDETETNKRYFFQAADTQVNLYVNDPEFTYSGNTDRISFLLVHVPDVTYWPSECERRFKLGDTLFQTEIRASSPNGMFLEPISADTFATDTLTDPYMLPGAGTSLDQTFDQNMWYMLETVLGPWVNAGVENRWDMDIRDDSETFYSFPDWPGAECVVPTDKIGHYRVYFQFPPGDADVLKYVMRVSDGNDEANYVNNTGSMTVIAKRATLAQVVEPGSEPVEGGCDGLYSPGQSLANSAILPNKEIGVYVPALVVDGIYALTTDGYWKDSPDVGELTLPQISDDNGVTWYDWKDYPSALCFETFIVDTRAQWRLYIRAEAGLVYKVRADDQDSNFLDNINFLYKLNVSEAQMLIDPFNTCTDAYQMTYVQLGAMADLIPGFMETGITVPTVSGQLYGIEIYKGAWQETDGGDDRYDAALSTDNGESFLPLSDRTISGVQCYAEIGSYEWIYFTASDDYTKIRVNGDDAEFADNEGALYYRLYAARNVGDPNVPGDGVNNYIPSAGLIGCYSSAARPAPFDLPEYEGLTLGSITDFDGLAQMVMDVINYNASVISYTWNNALGYIAGSISYHTTTAINFFLWCPEHTGAIKGIFNDALTLEPLNTMRRTVEFQKLTRAQIDSYDWEMDNTAAMPFSDEGGGIEVDSLMPDMSESPFVSGGSIEWTPIEGGGSDDYGSCNSHMVLRWGTENPLVVGFCSVLNLAKLTNANRIINIGIVLSAIVLFFRYIYKRWIMTLITLVSGGGLPQ